MSQEDSHLNSSRKNDDLDIKRKEAADVLSHLYEYNQLQTSGAVSHNEPLKETSSSLQSRNNAVSVIKRTEESIRQPSKIYPHALEEPNEYQMQVPETDAQNAPLKENLASNQFRDNAVSVITRNEEYIRQPSNINPHTLKEPNEYQMQVPETLVQNEPLMENLTSNQIRKNVGYYILNSANEALDQLSKNYSHVFEEPNNYRLQVPETVDQNKPLVDSLTFKSSRCYLQHRHPIDNEIFKKKRDVHEQAMVTFNSGAEKESSSRHDSSRVSRVHADVKSDAYCKNTIPFLNVGIDCLAVWHLDEEQQNLVLKLVDLQEKFASISEEDVEKVTHFTLGESDEDKRKRIQHVTEMIILSIPRIVGFALEVPGFLKIPREEQTLILKACAIEILFLKLARKYNPRADSTVFGNKRSYTRTNFKAACMGNFADKIFNFCFNMSKFKVDDVEYALLTTLLIFHERPFLPTMDNVKTCKEIYIKCLKAYVDKKSEVGVDRFKHLLVTLEDLRQLADIKFQEWFSTEAPSLQLVCMPLNPAMNISKNHPDEERLPANDYVSGTPNYS